ncbi:MAG TPA: D-alanyl-D-alanine carboxypeptidase [Baekduia sp.]
MPPRLFALPIAVAVLVAPAATAQAKTTKKTDATLRADLARLARGAGGKGGFVVLDGKTGRTLAQADPDTKRPLGSTTKLLTTGAAADAFAGAARLTTTAVTTAPLDAASGTLAGDLVLVGAGDPLLDEPQLQALADQVQARGVKVIAGSIVGDDSAFDAQRGGPATGGAFDLNMNGSIGALTYARGRQAPGGPFQPDPGRAAAFRFDDVLEARGVIVRRSPKAGVATPGSAQLGVVSTPVATVIKDINKTSDDFAAEVLAKDLVLAGGGPRPATTAAGAAAVARHARRLGATLSPFDGSGVDPRTKGSPRQLARYVRRIRTRAAIAASLPVAGVDGTLQTRMTTGPAHRTCRAKTGSLPQTGASALAGWCRTHGRTLVFAIQRSHVSGQPAAKAAEDAMVQRIAASRRR